MATQERSLKIVKNVNLLAWAAILTLPKRTPLVFMFYRKQMKEVKLT